MKIITTLMIGAAAIVVASAASYPDEMGLYRDAPISLHQREALNICAQQDRTFIRFLASDRDECYRQLRGVGVTANYSGVWSKPDRAHPQFAQN
jgi:hypothetical protein